MKLHDPFIIVPKRGVTLTIRRKDRLGKVARELQVALPLDRQQSREAVAFYFALGARLATKKLGGPWKPSELSVDPNRRYLISERSKQPHHM
jgi:hypothetical protein